MRELFGICAALLLMSLSCTTLKEHSLPGSVIVLSGNSSCGKSSAARELQTMLANRDKPYALLSQDEFMATLPKKWVNLDSGTYDFTNHPRGVQFVQKEDVRGKKVVLQISPYVAQLRKAALESVEAFSRSGINVILEGLFSKDEIMTAKRIFNKPLLAYVDCSLQAASQREKERRGFIGLARGLAEEFPLPNKKDFNVVVHTDNLSAKDVAETILSKL